MKIETKEFVSDTREYSYPLDKMSKEILASLREIGIDEEIIETLTISPSPDGIPGDYGFHCAPLAKVLKKNPNDISAELAARLKPLDTGYVSEYVSEGPYVNAKINYRKFASDVCTNVALLESDYGKEKIGTGQNIVIDMSSPNIAKRMSIGHLRSTIIGDSLARILKFLDYNVIKDNHLGDWGTQFGHLLRGIELWGNEDLISQNPIEELQKLYVKISDLGDPKSSVYKDLDPEEASLKADQVKDEGRAWFKKLESGDKEARAKWQQIVDWSLMDFNKMYDILGVEFDWSRGESFYETMLAGAIEKANEKGIITESEGALTVNMDDVGLRTAIIQKSDGATLYLTREIATGIHRSEEGHFDGMIYVVGEDQKFYFQQFFEILKRMGYPIADKSKHVYFGMIRLPEGKMSTRKGRVVLLEDVINEALARTREITNQRTQITTDSEKEALIRKIAIGALKWNDLSTDPKRAIVFDLDTMLALEGNSAPYVMYSHVRAISLIENAVVEPIDELKIDPQYESEKNLIKAISSFPAAVKEAAETYNPSKIATCVYDLAKAFNAFYHEVPILKEMDPSKKLSRLVITASFAQTIEIGLNLLGIEAPDKM